MRSLLREMEEKFHEVENSCDCGSPECTDCNTEEIDEQNVTGAVAGYNTPNAFRKTAKKVDYATGIEESSGPVSKTYKPGHYQVVEFDEEVQNDKFSFSIDDDIWWNKDTEYSANDNVKTPGTSHKKDYDQATRTNKLPIPNKTTQTGKNTLKVEDVLEKKYSELIESYRSFTTNKPDVTPAKKVNDTIREIAKKLQEIETLVTYNSKLKTESGVTSSHYGASTNKALTKISERLIKISERVRSLGE